MKTHAMKYYRIIPVVLIWFTGMMAAGQDPEHETLEPVEPVLEMTYLKDTEGVVNLRTSMVEYINRQPFPLEGLAVDFYAGEDSLVSLGSVSTDEDGMAVFRLEDISGLPASADHEIRFFAEYTGSDEILPAEYELYIVDAHVEMGLEMVDSIGTVYVRAYTDHDGEELPIVDEDIYVYVARLFNDLPVGEDFLDENGTFTVEIPGDIPGDPEGGIEVIARFNDHYLFGTVEARRTVPWGIPTDPHMPPAGRTLWTQIAPLWMIITLTILLTGVWSHYIYVIIQLIRVKKIAREEKEANLV